MIPSPSAATVLIVVYTLIILATVAIVARLYLRLKIQRRRLLFSDWLMMLAWCSAFASAPFDIVLSKYGALSPQIDYTLSNYQADLDTFKHVRKLIWAGAIPLFTTPYLCKYALLAVYLQLFPIFMEKRRIVLWATIVYSVVACITSLSLHLFLCFPVRRYWSLDDPEHMCGREQVATIFEVSWGLHFSSSLAVFFLPFLIFYGLNLPLRTKIGVYCVFLLGLVDLAFTLTRFLTIQLNNIGDFRSSTLIALWNSLDVYTGLIIACLPALRPYLRPNFGASDINTGSRSGRLAESAAFRIQERNRWFEETDESLSPEHIKGSARSRPTPYMVEFSRSYTWGNDEESNKSDIELVNTRSATMNNGSSQQRVVV